ncbi:PREDICTED: uncharacterized protein LOC101380657 [Odobenus rosmarus divergens]|uniref:Uncharacterized protein LOC101380657 n=1 Tax=Odobenus rosmarus divergens TaxID=9708 RepID=A0A9B0HAR2_ODORO
MGRHAHAGGVAARRVQPLRDERVRPSVAIFGRRVRGAAGTRAAGWGRAPPSLPNSLSAEKRSESPDWVPAVLPNGEPQFLGGTWTRPGRETGPQSPAADPRGPSSQTLRAASDCLGWWPASDSPISSSQRS